MKRNPQNRQGSSWISALLAPVLFGIAFPNSGTSSPSDLPGPPVSSDEGSFSEAGSAPIWLRTFSTHSRLGFKVDESVKVRWKDVPGGFELSFQGIGLADMGAPLGDEPVWLKQFEKVRDSRLASIRVIEEEGRVRIVGKWKFAKGSDAPAHPAMERFEYRNRASSQYLVDFWEKGGPTVRQIQAAIKKRSYEEELRKNREGAKRRQDRKIAREKAKADSEDVYRFCKEPLAESKDVFLPFTAVHEPVDFTKWFPITTADKNFRYTEPEGSARDAEYVRLALELYRQEKFALSIRTIDFLDNEYPKSPYRAEMKFLRVNALLKLGFREQAITLMDRLPLETQDTNVAVFSAGFLAISSMSQGAYVAALERFLWLIKSHPEHTYNWVYHLGAAEALYSMKETARAAKEYQWVVTNAPERKAQAIAAFRLGDLYLARQQYEQALAQYFQAVKTYGPESKEYPAVHLNRAESLYWLGKYDEAGADFRKFVENYPNFPGGWRATFRLAEIAGRKSGVESAKEMARQLYETINHYPYSVGAVLARSRLHTCGDHGGVDADVAERFFQNEALKLKADDDLITERYNDFRVLAYVRTMISMGREPHAVDVAISELRGTLGKETKTILADLLAQLFRSTIIKTLNSGDQYAALNFYQEKVKSVPPASLAKLDPDYLMRLSQAASDLSLGQTAKLLAEQFEKATAQASKVSAEASSGSAGRSIASAPAEADVDEKLKAAEQSYIEAKALWVASRMAETEKIERLLAKITEESPYSYERELMLGMIAESQGKHATALGHAVRAEVLAPANAKDDLRVMNWLASLHARAGDKSIAIQLYRTIQNKLKAGAKAGESAKAPQASPGASSGPGPERQPAQAKAEGALVEPTSAVLGLPVVPERYSLILSEGELLSEQGKWGEAARLYGRGIEEGLDGNQLIFEYARALGKSQLPADHEKARAAYQKLAQSKKDDFWKKLALEALANSEAKEGNQ